MAAGERDWVQIVLHETCPECGLRAAPIPPAHLAALIVDDAAAFASVLGSGPAVRRKPTPHVWSALEYACHVRDTLALFARRVDRMLAEDEPQLGWWDHEAAAVDEGYNGQDPGEVAAALVVSAALLAASLSGVGEQWDRTGIRREWERFTVADLARFALHETRHHLADARRSCSS